MEILKGGITVAPGFSAAARACGIKENGPDLAVIYSEKPCACAAVFTSNRFQGPCIALDREHLADPVVQAVVVNSGNANVATGPGGMRDARSLARAAAKELGIAVDRVLISSTGLIGTRLPLVAMRAGLKGIRGELRSSRAAGDRAARAIMTTDLRPKQVAVRIGEVVIGAMAKGSGMIHPEMGTMLAFVGTNASLPARTLNRTLRAAVARTFNRITVDGDTSTSDSVFLLANGTGPAVPAARFEQALELACGRLARMIVEDGEGATRVLRVEVRGARSEADAVRVGKAVAGSPLVKAAFGLMPIPGRILCAVGNSGASFTPCRVDVLYGTVPVVLRGAVVAYNRSAVDRVLGAREVPVVVDLHAGRRSAAVYGCDLTAEYVRINAQLYT